MRNFKVNVWIGAVAMALLIFGTSLTVSASEVRAANIAGLAEDNNVFGNMNDLETLKNAEEFEDAGFEDEELAALAIKLKLLGRDIEMLLKDEANLTRLFDPRVNKGFLNRDDMVKSLMMQEQLLARADERFAFDHDESSGSEREFLGIVRSRPAGLQGTWVIGRRTIRTTPGVTDFDQLAGPLVVGACAKVDFLANGRVREIDSEPGNCP